jgi:hypothetical protein
MYYDKTALFEMEKHRRTRIAHDPATMPAVRHGLRRTLGPIFDSSKNKLLLLNDLRNVNSVLALHFRQGR